MKRVLAIAAATTLTGCATYWHGTDQHVVVISDAPGAPVYVDGFYRGITPTEVHVSRKEDHIVAVYSGERVSTAKLERRLAVMPTVVGNLLMLNPFGIVGDLLNGAAWEFPPDVEVNFDRAPTPR